MTIQTAITDKPEHDLAMLRVSGELDFDMSPAFHKALQELLGFPRTKLVVDLSRISRMSSVFIGTLIDYGSRSRQAGKSLSVLMVEKLAAVCREAGLDKVVQIVVPKAP